MAHSDRVGVLLPSLALLTSQVSVNLGAAIAKNLFPVIGVEGITAFRVGFAAILLMAIFRPWRSALTRRDAGNLVLFGIVLGLMNLLIYRAFDRIPIGIAVAIEVTGPLSIVLLSSRRPRDFAYLAVAVFGLYLLLPFDAGPDRLDPAGIAYAFGAALCWALYIVFGKRASNLRGGHGVAWAMLVASLFTVPLGVAYSGAALLAPAVIMTGLAIAVLSSAIPYSLESVALRGLSQGLFGMLSSAAPAVSALAALVILGERLTGTQWLAIACIVAASAAAAWSARTAAS